EKAWKIAAFAQLRDLQADRASARVPEPLAIAIAAVQALRASLSISRCTQAFGIHLHHPLGDELDHLPQQVGIGALFGELSKCDIGFGGGHRVVLSELRCRNPTLPRLTMAAASSRSAARSYTTNQDAIGCVLPERALARDPLAERCSRLLRRKDSLARGDPIL